MLAHTHLAHTLCRVQSLNAVLQRVKTPQPIRMSVFEALGDVVTGLIQFPTTDDAINTVVYANNMPLDRDSGILKLSFCDPTTATFPA